MTLTEYQQYVAALAFGKRLPMAVYVYRGERASFGEGLDRLVAQVLAAFQVGPEFNVVKFRTDELKVSLLCYPRFFDDPHPALRHAITIDLVRGKARHADYGDNPNPPILHRKEAFLPSDHPQRRLFSELTEAEEAAGLYANTATIGFKLNWERLVVSKGLRYGGHRLLTAAAGESEPELTPPAPLVERHKTALVRYELSKPVRTLLEYGLIRPGVTFFDYGCGQGADMAGLRNLGYAADGWDPVHRPDPGKVAADVVNLGYVLNVIEDPGERLETIVEAFRHARRLLVVSALIRETVDTQSAASMRSRLMQRSARPLNWAVALDRRARTWALTSLRSVMKGPTCSIPSGGAWNRRCNAFSNLLE
jgi:hypothetical protein